MSSSDSTLANALAELRAPSTIRARCRNILDAGVRDELTHFEVVRDRLHHTAGFVATVTRERYPSLRVSEHSRFGHFDVNNVQRVAQLETALEEREPREQARCLAELVITSVLLDAGAGDNWRYQEASTGLMLSRSEGLAVASLDWAKSGALSSSGIAYQVDAAALLALETAQLERAFQVRSDNPLVGSEGRVQLLRALGAAVERKPALFGQPARLGGIIDHLCAAADGGRLPAASILAAVLEGLGEIWPGRLSLEGHPLGDVWRHPAAGGGGLSDQLVPFHKLSQWLSYSLIYPLRVAGLTITELDALTGLAEYRNGGLFVDEGVLVPKHAAVTQRMHNVGDEVIVEWRALTVALLDELAPLVRAELGRSPEQMPLAAVLEGGSWAAGRVLAKRLRAGGGPPIQLRSDGTVF